MLRRLGYYALVLRMPGHGTVPGALTEAHWEDWRAAVRLGARHVRPARSAPEPFVLVGYSNGGALSVQYALDSLGRADAAEARSHPPLLADDRRLARSPSSRRIVAAIGSDPLLRAVALDGRPARVHPVQVQLVSGLRRPADRRADAGDQTAIVREAAESGAIKYAAADPGVRRRSWTRPSTPGPRSTASSRYLPENGSELVLFDLNRSEIVRCAS